MSEQSVCNYSGVRRYATVSYQAKPIYSTNVTSKTYANFKPSYVRQKPANDKRN